MFKIVKTYDKDLKLYLDIKDSFYDYLRTLKSLKTYKNDVFKQKKKEIELLLSKLANRLKIQTIERFMYNDKIQI